MNDYLTLVLLLIVLCIYVSAQLLHGQALHCLEMLQDLVVAVMIHKLFVAELANCIRLCPTIFYFEVFPQ